MNLVLSQMGTRGGGGQKFPKFCGRHIWMVPKLASRNRQREARPLHLLKDHRREGGQGQGPRSFLHLREYLYSIEIANSSGEASDDDV